MKKETVWLSNHLPLASDVFSNCKLGKENILFLEIVQEGTSEKHLESLLPPSIHGRKDPKSIHPYFSYL